MAKFSEMESLFKALADETRLRILGLLLAGEVCVCDIHDCLNVPQPKVSRHLAYLRRAGLVASRREGLWIHYRLNPLADPTLAALFEAVCRSVSQAEGVRQDAGRLAERTGCRIPPADPVDTGAPVVIRWRGGRPVGSIRA